tara:strand:+ start:1115 stop:1402 length:288 start_codon:yes stop_codon:yes gene_type:complete
MKSIQPITSWSSGQSVQANTLNMYSINDNLSTSATFYYQILAVITDIDGNQISSTQVAEGNLYMGGADYEDWGNATDINEAAYVWAAQQLNLILV